jgi:hypothetical protein
VVVVVVVLLLLIVLTGEFLASLVAVDAVAAEVVSGSMGTLVSDQSNLSERALFLFL